MRRLATVALGALLFLACRGEGVEGRPRVDERLLSALGLAQAYQHQADELEALGDQRAAVARVRLVLEVPFPDGAPEREDVRLDAHGRIAELLLEEGDDAGAEEAARAGLAEASRPSYFQARLHAVMGRVLQTRAARLREAGQTEEAARAGREAIEAFERSIDMNRAVLGLAGPHPGGGRDGGGRSR